VVGVKVVKVDDVTVGTVVCVVVGVEGNVVVWVLVDCVLVKDVWVVRVDVLVGVVSCVVVVCIVVGLLTIFTCIWKNGLVFTSPGITTYWWSDYVTLPDTTFDSCLNRIISWIDMCTDLNIAQLSRTCRLNSRMLHWSRWSCLLFSPTKLDKLRVREEEFNVQALTTAKNYFNLWQGYFQSSCSCCRNLHIIAQIATVLRGIHINSDGVWAWSLMVL